MTPDPTTAPDPVPVVCECCGAPSWLVTCAACGLEFTAGTPRARYCGTRCRVAAHRRR